MLHFVSPVVHSHFVDQKKNRALQMVVIVTGKLHWNKAKVCQSMKSQPNTQPA